jgi:hypothetical protein
MSDEHIYGPMRLVVTGTKRADGVPYTEITCGPDTYTMPEVRAVVETNAMEYLRREIRSEPTRLTWIDLGRPELLGSVIEDRRLET